MVMMAISDDNMILWTNDLINSLNHNEWSWEWWWWSWWWQWWLIMNVHDCGDGDDNTHCVVNNNTLPQLHTATAAIICNDTSQLPLEENNAHHHHRSRGQWIWKITTHRRDPCKLRLRSPSPQLRSPSNLSTYPTGRLHLTHLIWFLMLGVDVPNQTQVWKQCWHHFPKSAGFILMLPRCGMNADPCEFFFHSGSSWMGNQFIVNVFP